MAYKAGRQVMELVKAGLKVSDIVTMEAFENAIMVHAAISGSTNSLLHIPAMAHELGLEIDADTFDRMHRGAHYLLDIRPAGKWPAQFSITQAASLPSWRKSNPCSIWMS